MEKFVDIAYLVAAISFIYGLKMLSHPKTARNGNIIASVGMLIAIKISKLNSLCSYDTLNQVENLYNKYSLIKNLN